MALARSYENLALVRQPFRGNKESLEANQTAIGLFKELADEFPTVALYRQELAEAYLLSNGPSRFLLASDDARSRIQEAQRLAEQLHADYPQVPEYTLLLARTTSRNGMLLAGKLQFAEALREHRRSVDLLQSLVDRCPSVPWFKFLLASGRQTLGEYLRLAKRLPESREELERGIKATEELFGGQRQMPYGAQFFLAKQYVSLATTLREMGETRLADEAKAKAQAMMPTPGPPRPPPRHHKCGQLGQLDEPENGAGHGNAHVPIERAERHGPKRRLQEGDVDHHHLQRRGKQDGQPNPRVAKQADQALRSDARALKMLNS